MSHRRLMVQGLESRAMLAGDVTVSVTDGILRLQGDEFSNDIVIVRLNTTGQGTKVAIHGTNASGVVTTRINGQDSIEVEGITKGAILGLGNGNNRLEIGNTSSGDHARQPVDFQGRVKIGASSGNDRIAVSIYSNSGVAINAGAGDDKIYMIKSRFHNLTVNSDPLPVEGREPVGGDDEVRMRSIIATGAVAIAGGIGDDQVWAVLNNTGYWGNVALNLGDGNDRIEVGLSVKFQGGVSISGGNGSDVLRTGASISDAFHAELGSGNDLLFCSGTSTTVLEISLGGDNDTATVFSELLAGITLDGGSGTDRLTQHSSNPEGDETFISFEENG